MADAASDIEEAGSNNVLKDVFAGAVGGMAQVLIGQPFDIVKVRLQTGNAHSSALSAFRHIYAHEGALAFYKGTLTPLIGIGACVSVQFGAFHAARRHLESLNASRSLDASPTLSLAQFYLAGAFAGVANSVLSGPIEHVRIRLQTQPHEAAARLYHGPADCIRKLSAATNGGVLRGLFRGQVVTVFREAQAYGLWFLTFEYLMNRSAAKQAIARKEIPAWKVALFGGIAGEALWLGSYPLDVVKSRLQTDQLGSKSKYRGALDCFAQVWRREGMRGFWRGIGPTLGRAMPVSAGTFAVVEGVRRAID